jgi:hypothetical protein
MNIQAGTFSRALRESSEKTPSIRQPQRDVVHDPFMQFRPGLKGESGFARRTEEPKVGMRSLQESSGGAGRI